MKIKIITKKASSSKVMSETLLEITEVNTLREFLIAVCKYEYNKQYAPNLSEAIMQEHTGKIIFSELYNKHKEPMDKAIHTMLQDFEDGLFRVFINRVECKSLDENIVIKEQDECVFMRLVMLAGRLW